MTVVVELNERAFSGLGRLVPMSLNGWNGCLRCTGAWKLPLWPECQHPGAVARELKLYDPWKNDKVYIYSLRTNRGVVFQSLQFVMANPLSNVTGKWLHWGRNLVLRRIYIRRFPDPDPPRVVDNPERILRRGNTQADKGISHLRRASSLPAESVSSFTKFWFW